VTFVASGDQDHKLSVLRAPLGGEAGNFGITELGGSPRKPEGKAGVWERLRHSARIFNEKKGKGEGKLLSGGGAARARKVGAKGDRGRRGTFLQGGKG